jgi:hypothetical protein
MQNTLAGDRIKCYGDLKKTKNSRYCAIGWKIKHMMEWISAYFTEITSGNAGHEMNF